MGSKTQTGLLLVLGTIASVIGWIGLYPADGTESAAEQAKKIMADPDIAKAGILLGYGGMAGLVLAYALVGHRRRRQVVQWDNDSDEPLDDDWDGLEPADGTAEQSGIR